MAECCICGKALNGTAWVCLACEAEYHLPHDFASWPTWAKALKCFEQEDRRYWQEEADQLAYHDDSQMTR